MVNILYENLGRLSEKDAMDMFQFDCVYVCL